MEPRRSHIYGVMAEFDTPDQLAPPAIAAWMPIRRSPSKALLRPWA